MRVKPGNEARLNACDGRRCLPDAASSRRRLADGTLQTPSGRWPSTIQRLADVVSGRSGSQTPSDAVRLSDKKKILSRARFKLEGANTPPNDTLQVRVGTQEPLLILPVRNTLKLSRARLKLEGGMNTPPYDTEYFG